MSAEYNTLTVEATENGWVVTEKGQPKKLFFLWRTLQSHLEARLSSK